MSDKKDLSQNSANYPKQSQEEPGLQSLMSPVPDDGATSYIGHERLKNKKALITGVTGQDGAYLAELLLGKGYEVHGLKRRASSFNTARIDHLYEDRHETNVRMFLHYGDMTDSTNLIRIVQEVQPDEEPGGCRNKYRE